MRSELEEISDLTILTDSANKNKLFDSVEQKTKADRQTIKAIYSKLIKSTAKKRDLDPDTFKKQATPKYSSNLQLKVNSKKKEIDQSKTTKTKLTAQNPNTQEVKEAEIKKELPMSSMVGAVDTCITGLVANMPEMTQDEKKDIGTCLDMCIGDYIREHKKARVAFGFCGILGYYGSRFRQARKVTKEEKKKEKQLEETETKRLDSKITKEDKKTFEAQAEAYTQEMLKDDT